MDDSRIPWWLVLLLGIGMAGLAVWQSSRWKPQLRFGAGALGLVYLALLAYLIGGDPRAGMAARAWQLPSLLSVGFCSLSVIAAVLMAGRPAYRGQLVWFLVFSLSNAALCCVWGAVSPGILLSVVAISTGCLLLLDLRQGPTMHVGELWPTIVHDDESPYLAWLTGGTGLVLAVALIGTSYHALRVESSRAIATRRHSAMPSQSRLRTVLNIQPEQERKTSFVDLALGHRGDVIILVTILAFIAMASSTSTCRRQEVALPAELPNTKV